MTGRLILAGANVLAPDGRAFLADRTVVLEGDRITAVQPGPVAAGPDDELHELDGRWIIPGLIDAHFHLVSRSAEHVDDRLVAASVIEGVVTAAAIVRAGVTTVRDCGCRHHGIHELKAAMGTLIPGPRAFVAGRNPTGVDAPRHWRNVIAEGRDGVREAVRAEIAAGADFIKLVLAHARRPTDWSQVDQYLSEPEMRAAVGEAHAQGVLIGCHCEGLEVAAAAVRSGFDVLDHAPLIDAETAALMAERGTVYVPTLWGFSDDSGIDLETLAASEAEAVRHWRAEHRMSVQRAVSAGVTVAAGSDAAGWLPPADVLRRELAALAACGLDNVDLLSAATLGAATALGESGTLGVVAPGAVADLLVLAEDPHTDLDSLADPQLVISRGRPAGDGWEPDRALAATATTERWVDP